MKRTRKIVRKWLRGGKTRKLVDIFPYKRGLKSSQLRMTPEGEYSITQREDGHTLLKHMRSVLGSTHDKTITDATGNVGGDTILFGLHFKHVDSIELQDENYNALENNVKAYGLANITLHKGDSTKLYNWYSDVLYIDAPWGGPDYKAKKDLDLYLGDTRLDTFIDYVASQPWKPRYIFLKLPRNYNFSRLDAYSYTKHPIRRYFVVSIEL